MTELGEIDTVAGTVILPVALTAIVAAETIGPLIVAVQAATAPGVRDAGVHTSPLRTGIAKVVAVPPVAVVVIGVLSKATPILLETPMDAEAVPIRVTVTVATLPSAMRLLLMPLAMHV